MRAAGANLSNSSLKGSLPQQLSPPRPVPVGSPPWIMKPFTTLVYHHAQEHKAESISRLTDAGPGRRRQPPSPPSPMEGQAVVGAPGTERQEVLGCARHEVGVDLQVEVAQIGLQLHVALLAHLHMRMGDRQHSTTRATSRVCPVVGLMPR